MKFYSLLFLLTFMISCKETKKVITERHDKIDTPYSQKYPQLEKKDTCWMGSINGNIPVFIHYQKQDDIIVGEIFYLSTIEKHPRRLIGPTNNGKGYRLLEFDITGNITGIITGKPNNNAFEGNWFSPETRKSLDMKLISKDTSIISVDLVPQMRDISGDYHYKYGEEGPAGLFTINKMDSIRAWFELHTVTSIPARNMADISRDTILLNLNGFEYEVPHTEDCRIGVKFYKGFAYTRYTKGDCAGQFGNNATAEGIFIKQ